MELEKIVANLAQKVERRFFGKYRGLVVDDADPEMLGRLKIQVPSVLGADVVTGWALPCLPYGGDVNQGMLFIPEVGAGVWVEFEEGDLEFPIWVGTFWSKPDGESELPKPNDADGTEQDSVQDPPTRKIFKTKAGHTLQFEDAEGEEMILLNDAVNQHVLAMNQDGITLSDGTNDNSVVMDSNGILVTDANSSTVTLDSAGITVADGVNNHEVALSGQGISVTDGVNQHQVNLDSMGVSIQAVSGAKIEITAAGITIDSAGTPIQVNGTPVMLSSSAALPVARLTDQGIGNLGAPVVITAVGNPMVLA